MPKRRARPLRKPCGRLQARADLLPARRARPALSAGYAVGAASHRSANRRSAFTVLPGAAGQRDDLLFGPIRPARHSYVPRREGRPPPGLQPGHALEGAEGRLQRGRIDGVPGPGPSGGEQHPGDQVVPPAPPCRAREHAGGGLLGVAESALEQRDPGGEQREPLLLVPHHRPAVGGLQPHPGEPRVRLVGVPRQHRALDEVEGRLRVRFGEGGEVLPGQRRGVLVVGGAEPAHAAQHPAAHVVHAPAHALEAGVLAAREPLGGVEGGECLDRPTQHAQGVHAGEVPVSGPVRVADAGGIDQHLLGEFECLDRAALVHPQRRQPHPLDPVAAGRGAGQGLGEGIVSRRQVALGVPDPAGERGTCSARLAVPGLAGAQFREPERSAVGALVVRGPAGQLVARGARPGGDGRLCGHPGAG